MVCLADMVMASDAGYTEQATAQSRQKKHGAQRSLFSDSDGVLYGGGAIAEAEKFDEDDADSNAECDRDDAAHDSSDSDYENNDSDASDDSDASVAPSQRHQLSLKRERVGSTRAAPLACTLCGETFTTDQRLAAHAQLPHEFVCDIEGCNRRFADEELAIRHVTAWHEVRDNERYACKSCNGRFLTRHDLELHRQQLDHVGSAMRKPMRLFVCDVVPTCEQVYKKKDKLAQHLKRYHEANDDGEAFECDRCADSFPTRHERLQHRQFAHPDLLGEPKSPSYSCEVIGCGKSYSKREHLTRHVRATHAAPQEKPFCCHLCGVRFVYKHGLTRHYDNCHSVDAQKPYSCTVCLLAFKKKSLLQAHSYVHKGVLPFECGDCGEKFLKKFQLARHERSHATQKPSQTQVFLCDEDGCDELLFSKQEKAEHMLQVHGLGVKEEAEPSHSTNDNSKMKKEKARRPSSAGIGRKLRCLVCEREFERVQNLRSHLRTHFEAVDERKQHVCPMEGCDKAYTKKSNVMAHYNAVHDPVKSTRFKCPHDGCDGAFGYKTVLANHIASVHEKRAVKNEKHENGDAKDMRNQSDEEEDTPRKKQRRGRAAMSSFTRLLGLNQVGHKLTPMATLDPEYQNKVETHSDV